VIDGVDRTSDQLSSELLVVAAAEEMLSELKKHEACLEELADLQAARGDDEACLKILGGWFNKAPSTVEVNWFHQQFLPIDS